MEQGHGTGVFGGTFDPPHNGHIQAAHDIRSELALDRVLFVVANDPWQKTAEQHITPAADRFALVEAAVADEAGLEASDIEIVRGGPSYMIDTLDELARRAPGEDLFVIIGRDAAEGLHTWERAPELATRAAFVVIERPGAGAEPLPTGFDLRSVESIGLDVSSSDIRRRRAAGDDIADLVPARVAVCIEDRDLYRDPGPYRGAHDA